MIYFLDSYSIGDTHIPINSEFPNTTFCVNSQENLIVCEYTSLSSKIQELFNIADLFYSNLSDIVIPSGLIRNMFERIVAYYIDRDLNLINNNWECSGNYAPVGCSKINTEKLPYLDVENFNSAKANLDMLFNDRVAKQLNMVKDELISLNDLFGYVANQYAERGMILTVEENDNE